MPPSNYLAHILASAAANKSRACHLRAANALGNGHQFNVDPSVRFARPFGYGLYSDLAHRYYHYLKYFLIGVDNVIIFFVSCIGGAQYTIHYH